MATNDDPEFEPVHDTSPTDHVLTELQLFGHRPFQDEPDPRPLPEANVITGAVVDIFDALVSTLSDTRLEPDLENLLWSTANLFHRAVDRIERELDGNERDQQRSQREQNGSEVRSVELERLTAQGLTLIERRNAFELFRDQAAERFEAHTGSAWRPRTGSMVNHRALTAAMVDSRDFLAARRRAETELLIPAGPKIAFTGGVDCNDHKLIWASLDKVRAKHPDMVLLHGGSPTGAERKAGFEEAGSHFESSYFLTFIYLPPAEDAAWAERWLYEGRSGKGVDPREILHGFVDRTDRVLQLIENFMPECAWLDDGQTLTYLHSTVSTRRQRVRVPETPMYLDALLADQPLEGGLEPRLGDQHLRILTIVGFPSVTTPGLLDELNRLAFPYRWSTRAILMDKTDATRLLTRIRRQWFAKRKSVAAILKEVMTNEASVLVDTDAANKAADADMALQELGADHAGQAYVTATITVWDGDPQLAAEKLRLVEKVVQGRDFTAMPETLNAVDAWLGSLPGHVYANVRQPPVSTLNLAHMIPLSAVWAGPERDDHFGAPSLLYGKTEGSTPFRFSLHVGDVGHTLVVGPTGSGKSVLLALMALQFRRYPGSQVFAFDFGGSIRAATLAMGGDWHDLGGGLSEGVADSVSLQPLAGIDQVPERAWAADWIVAILVREGIAITPEVKEHLWTALTSLASAPAGERTITGLAVLLQSNELKQALRPFCVGGAYGRLLDAEREHLGEASVQAFETEGLIGTGAAPAVLSYLFHRIEDRLDGRPTLLIVDEGWLALDDEDFAGQLREWLKTLRKKNASVVFATQSLSDIDHSAIAPAIIESCPTRLLLPNERAIEPQITAIYRRFGLNDRQIEILSRAMPKRDYYYQSRRGNRLFELGLSDAALALCAASSKTDQAAIETVLAEQGRDGFLAAWLGLRGVAWAADLIPGLTNLETKP